MTGISKLASVKRFADVPGPRGLPFIGTALEYIFKQDGLALNKLFEAYSRRATEYGPIYKEKIGPMTNVVVSDLREYRKIMQKEGKMPKRWPLEPLQVYRLCKGMGEGLVTANGPEWLRHRNAINKKLLKPEAVNSVAPEMNVVADDLVNYLAGGLDESGRYRKSIEDTLFRWALESVGSALLGKRIGALDDGSEPGQEFAKNLREVFKGMQELMFGIPMYKHVSTPGWRTFVGHCNRLFGFGASVLTPRTSQTCPSAGDGSGGDSGSLLGDLMRENGELSKTEVKALVVELLAASIETVANTMLWCLYRISEPHSDFQDKLYDEVCRSIPHGEQVNLNSASGMPYVKACVKETLRLYPPAFTTSRYLQEDVEVCGYLLPTGTHVQANTYHMNRSPSWFERPTAFDPERWIAKNSPDAAVVNQLVWGHGARMCIGRRLAEQEMYIALSKIVKKFRIYYDGEVEPQPIMNVVLYPDIPMRMRFIERL